MRIVHAITSVDLRLGGTARAVIDLAEAMAARGHEVTVITANAIDVPDAWRAGAPARPRSIVDHGPYPLLSLAGASDETRAAFRNADVVHFHAMWEIFNVRLAAECRASGVPYITTPHGMLDDWCMAQGAWKKKLHLKLRGTAMLESAAYVHCTAAAELAQSAKWFPSGRGRVVANLMDLRSYENLPGVAEAEARFPQLREHAVRLLFLSRVSQKKGVEHLVDAVAALVRDGVDAIAMIAGTADEPYAAMLRERVARLGLAERVHFLGHVGGTLKISLIEGCDMLVVPSSQENFGFVFFESLAAGTAVVTTDLVDTRDELRGSGGAVIVQQNGAAVAAGVHEILERTKAHSIDMGAARRWVFRECDPNSVASQFEAMYADASAMRVPCR